MKNSLPIALTARSWHLSYGKAKALTNLNIDIPEKQVTAFIGPSGCGKSTFLRCFNRMNDVIEDVHVQGSMMLYDEDIYDQRVDISILRQRVGLVFQRPNPFPKSIFENVAYGLRIQRKTNKRELAETIEWALQHANLWDEVKDRLDDNAFSLSGGQQQRLVIARAIAVKPQVLLLDEPTSALDPLSTLKIEELILQLKKDYTVVIVTHNMQQAARVSDYTAFFYIGELVEFDATTTIFSTPKEKQTEDYITGRFG